MKNTLFAIVALFSLIMLKAQEKEITSSESTGKGLRLKANAPFLLIGIVNVAGEFQVAKKWTVQTDVLISPWKSFSGHELQYYSASAEGRYYFKEAFSGFYLGANLGASAFNVQKWNYWDDGTYINAKNEVYNRSDLYQKGFSLLFGATAGYQFRLSDRWFMDIYGTLGTSQDFYKGYERGTGRRYEDASGYNRSGEIIPYRGGVMISYKLK